MLHCTSVTIRHHTMKSRIKMVVSSQAVEKQLQYTKKINFFWIAKFACKIMIIQNKRSLLVKNSKYLVLNTKKIKKASF